MPSGKEEAVATDIISGERMVLLIHDSQFYDPWAAFEVYGQQHLISNLFCWGTLDLVDGECHVKHTWGR